MIYKQSFKIFLWYPEPGSNRHDHFWSQDFKSGVSTYSTIRATAFQSKSTAKVAKNRQSTKSRCRMMSSSSSGANHRISGSRRNHVICRLAYRRELRLIRSIASSRVVRPSK